MKSITAALLAFALLCSASASAQTNYGGGNASGAGAAQGKAENTPPGATQGVQPGKAANSMNQLGSPESGASSPQGTLMQKREQGMSQQGDARKGSSGAVKQ